MSGSTPIAFFIFRRPEVTRRVFERIREARPERLFVVADGPRSAEEAERCRQAREVTEAVDWPCEVSRSYAEENVGARRCISRGLDWVFEQEEEVIILEDDCLPDPSFFGYCNELLDRYRDEERVFSITGDNFQRGQRRGDGSYYFSDYFHGWGWATWRRAWAHYDHELEQWPAFRDGGGLDTLFPDPVESGYWCGLLDGIRKTGVPDAWDYIWLLTQWMHGGMTIVPNVNLVENIGFGSGATNTTNEGGWIADRRADRIGSLTHPDAVCADPEADSYTLDCVFGAKRRRREGRPWFRLRKWIWQIRQRLSGRVV